MMRNKAHIGNKMAALLPLLMLTSCVAMSDTGGGDNVARYRGDEGLSGYSNVSVRRAPAMLWSFKSDARTASSPIINEGVTYWIDKRGKVYGVDKGGAQTFEYDFGSASETTPLIVDSVIYVGMMNGRMNALSMATKDTLWSFETWGQISSPPNYVKSKSAIIFGSYDNYVYLLDKTTGAEINHFETGYYINGAVAVRDNFAIFGGCDGWLRVVDYFRGQAVDSVKVDNYIPQSAAIYGNQAYAGDYSGNIYELTLGEKGLVSFSKIRSSPSEKSPFTGVPAVDDKYIYIIEDNYIAAVERSTQVQKWRVMLAADTGESSPLIVRDKVLICTKSGIVSLIDKESGELLWEWDAGETITANPVASQGRFYILTAKGTLFCFE